MLSRFLLAAATSAIPYQTMSRCTKEENSDKCVLYITRTKTHDIIDLKIPLLFGFKRFIIALYLKIFQFLMQCYELEI